MLATFRKYVAAGNPETELKRDALYPVIQGYIRRLPKDQSIARGLGIQFSRYSAKTVTLQDFADVHLREIVDGYLARMNTARMQPNYRFKYPTVAELTGALNEPELKGIMMQLYLKNRQMTSQCTVRVFGSNHMHREILDVIDGMLRYESGLRSKNPREGSVSYLRERLKMDHPVDHTDDPGIDLSVVNFLSSRSYEIADETVRYLERFPNTEVPDERLVYDSLLEVYHRDRGNSWDMNKRAQMRAERAELEERIQAEQERLRRLESQVQSLNLDYQSLPDAMDTETIPESSLAEINWSSVDIPPVYEAPAEPLLPPPPSYDEVMGMSTAESRNLATHID